MGVDASLVEKLSPPVEEAEIRGDESGANLREGRQARRAGREREADRERHEEDRGRDASCAVARHGSTASGAIGTSANVSGAYIASTREGGSSKTPSWFSTSTYESSKRPCGIHS